MTKRETLEKTAAMWAWLTENPGKSKLDYLCIGPAHADYCMPASECYCCEYVKQEHDGDCEMCPLLNYAWRECGCTANGTLDVADACYRDPKSPYRAWRSAITDCERVKFALEIRDAARKALNELKEIK